MPAMEHFPTAQPWGELMWGPAELHTKLGKDSEVQLFFLICFHFIVVGVLVFAF